MPKNLGHDVTRKLSKSPWPMFTDQLLTSPVPETSDCGSRFTVFPPGKSCQPSAGPSTLIPSPSTPEPKKVTYVQKANQLASTQRLH